MTITISTAGRHSRFNVYEHLAAAYQDSGLLAQLMCGNLDAPERMPAGGVQVDKSWTYGQRAAAITHTREQMNKQRMVELTPAKAWPFPTEQQPIDNRN